MEAPSMDFLDVTSSSQVVKSPIKTSTVSKENIKWNEDVFFQRQDFVQASESLFCLPPESPITASNGPLFRKEQVEKLKFNFNQHSYLSEGGNSSLGILQIENLSDFSESSFQETTKRAKKQKSKKKLQRLPRVSSENSYVFKSGTCEISKEIPFYPNEPSLKESDKDSASSSDIEYDGTNIPELNMDWDVKSLRKSDIAPISNCDHLNSKFQSKMCDTVTRNESDLFASGKSSSEFSHKESLKCDSIGKSISENKRESIFKNFSLSHNSLHQLAFETETSPKNFDEKVPGRIKVCPFLGISSFEVEPILQNHYNGGNSPDIENARYNQNLSVDFCPEEISARSSSFKSSVKGDLSMMSNISSQRTTCESFQQKVSQLEDLENEVLSGSCFLTSETVLKSKMESNEDNKDSGFSAKSQDSNTISQNADSSSVFFDLPALQTDFVAENVSGFVADSDNWCSRLGISESEFFSSDCAKEILRKDKEAFEREQLLEASLNKVSGVSNWSPPNLHEITPPSWFTELNQDQHLSSDRHISIGTLIRARSEDTGSLSGDEKRERPYFGTTVVTPTKHRSSNHNESVDSLAQINSVEEKFQDNSYKNMRDSVLSQYLNDISLSNPADVASKLMKKCTPDLDACRSEKSGKVHNNHNAKSENKLQFITDISKEPFETVLSDIEESDNTLLKSASDSSISKQSDCTTEGVNKSTTAEFVQCMDNNSLNFSLGSASERESIKTTKSDACTNCSLPRSNHNASQEFSRPASSCSSSCSNPGSLGNPFNVPYGCMKYLSSCTEQCQNGVCNLLQVGSSSVPCPHVCAEHAMRTNLLSIGVTNALQPAIQNTLSGPLYLPGNSVSFTEIQAPSELCFPEKIALGDSQEMNLTIRNSNGVSCYFLISCESAYLNDSPLPFGMSGLSYNKTVPCSYGNTTDIKLILAPRYEGKTVVNLQIDAFLNSVNQLNATPVGTTKTKIIYEVVQPSVSILHKGKKTLNVRPVIAGSTFVEYITIINNCEVPVPLRICLSDSSLGNQIYFGLKEMDRQKHPSSAGPRFLSPKVMLYRIPASKNKSLRSSLDIPIVFESISGPINCTVTAAIETPTLSEILASINIGKAKLMLKDTNQNPLVLKASKGATCSHTVTVVNEGTLPVVYAIHIEGDSDVLSVSPNTVDLQPNQCATVSVTYVPQTYDTVKGRLLATAELYGQIFTIAEITGHAKENYYKSQNSSNTQVLPTRPTSDSMDYASESPSFIECNKRYLAWGGCDIGSITEKTFVLRNPSKEPVHVKVFIKDKSQGFLLIDESSQKIAHYTLLVNAKEEKHLSVVFMPKNVECYSGSLYIKSILESDSRVSLIRLSGYGGISKLKVLGLPDGEGTGYCLDVESNGANVVHKNIVLHNTGCRAAFVKLLITYDSLVQNPIAKQTVINPSEFILLKNEKKSVFVSVNCLNKNQMSSNEVISVFYGDEILRQKLRRKLNCNSSVNNSACNINFNISYDGEDRVPYDSLYESPKDEALFYSNLKKLLIHIFFNGQDTSFSRMSFHALSEINDSLTNLTLNSTLLPNSSLAAQFRGLTIEDHSPPVKESAGRRISRLYMPPPEFNDSFLEAVDTAAYASTISEELQNMKLDLWTVHPEELIINTDSKDKRILLKSCSDLDMRFKTEWTIDVITISPSSGILPANGEIGLRLTLINTNHNKLLEDYHDNIKVLCGGIEKNVSIKIVKDRRRIRNSSPVPTILNESLRSGAVGDSYILDNTTLRVEPLSQSITVENIFSFPKEIELQSTKQNVYSETVLIVGNPTNDAVTWNIRPVTIMFTEPSEDSVDCTRSPFEFTTPNGILNPMETDNIVIEFFPQCVARFYRFFELVLCIEGGKKQSNNFKVLAEAVADLITNDKEKGSDGKGLKKRSKRVKKELFVESDVCEFPSATSGQKSPGAIVIKNLSLQDHKFTITKPKLPFIVNFSTCSVKSKRFIRIPVCFKPSKPGNYESEVKFISGNGNELKVKLSGLCSA